METAKKDAPLSFPLLSLSTLLVLLYSGRASLILPTLVLRLTGPLSLLLHLCHSPVSRRVAAEGVCVLRGRKDQVGQGRDGGKMSRGGGGGGGEGGGEGDGRR